MKRHLDQRGAALIVVILIISLIVTLTLQFSRSSRSAVFDTMNLSDAVKLGYVAKSGFNVVTAFLLADKNNFDSLAEDWAKTEAFSSRSKEYFEGAACELTVEDEAGKIPLNKLVEGNAFNPDIRHILIRLLSLPEFSLEESRAHEIVNSIKDWVDQDNDMTETGAETSYYETLSNPYHSKNAPLDCIEELLMIKGITKELLYGTESTPALLDCITLYGEGKININTASKYVLRALSPDITEEMTEEMDTYRRSGENDLSDPNWSKRVTGMANVTIPSMLITVKSNIFKIISSGTLDQMKESISGTIKRDQNNLSITILTWNVM